jgi:hypothetical protein
LPRYWCCSSPFPSGEGVNVLANSITNLGDLPMGPKEVSMRRPFFALLAVTAASYLFGFVQQADAQGKAWGTIKGRIVWGGKEMPEAEVVTPKGADAKYCCQNNPGGNVVKGIILEHTFVVNAKNKGLRDVFVYILVDPGQEIPIHKDLRKIKENEKEVVIDQPGCHFVPRAIGIREGQVLVVKNSKDPFNHSFRWIGDGNNNQGGNIVIKPGGKEEIKDLKAQRLPLPIDCALHGWMKGQLGVFSHPYFAITDADGAFEIKLAPAGKHKLMIYHNTGYRLGTDGKEGEDVTVKGGDAVTDLGELPMGK